MVSKSDGFVRFFEGFQFLVNAALNVYKCFGCFPCKQTLEYEFDQPNLYSRQSARIIK